MVTINGMVETEMRLDAAELVAKMGGQEERLYRHRCVEAWAMAVPWTGIQMSKLVELAQPTSGAKYIRMETFHDLILHLASASHGIHGHMLKG